MPTNSLALARLVIIERQSLMRAVRRVIGDRATAEDVTQTLWVRVQRVEDDPPILNHRAYLYRLAINLARDEARIARRRDALVSESFILDAIPSSEPSIEQKLLDRETLNQISAAMTELSPRCREILLLRRVDGLSAVEIGERLGITRHMVARYIRQAMEHLQDRLDCDAC